MHLNVLKKTSQELKFEISGERHTFCNLLESVLLEDKKVDFASYNVPHPLISKTIVFIRTKKNKRPEVSLLEAVQKMRQRGKEFNDAFLKELNEVQETDELDKIEEREK